MRNFFDRKVDFVSEGEIDLAEKQSLCKLTGRCAIKNSNINLTAANLVIVVQLLDYCFIVSFVQLV